MHSTSGSDSMGHYQQLLQEEKVAGYFKKSINISHSQEVITC